MASPGVGVKFIKKPARKIPAAKKARRQGPPLRKRGISSTKVRQTDVPDDVVPGDRTWTLPEYHVWWYLTNKRRMIEMVDFEFQSSLWGGRQQYGGLVIDFMVFDRFAPGLVINVQGEFFHTFSTTLRAKDLMDKIRLQGYGFTVVYVKEDDVLRDLAGTIDAALVGIQLYHDTV